MTEELAAFLELAQKFRSDPEDIREVLRVLHTMEGYMTKQQWELYQALKVEAASHK